MRPWTTVRIVGPSMEPALRNGDWWIVRRTGRIRVGQVVAARHPNRPDLIVVKRVVRQSDAGLWLEGDNPDASDDSRSFGAIPPQAVVGVLWLRYRRGPI